ncbi:hypothetical protein [Celeribacter sp.]|uniref:hypothetical protein n=1 Tax=Celeribacter sp. TaxID=1890673 RepID=UPI003A914138
MKVHLHIGVHFTNTTRLLKAVRKNERVYRRHDVIVPPVTAYRAQIDDMVQRLNGQPAAPEDSEAFLETLTAGQTDASGLIMIDERWSGPLEQAFEERMLYASIADRVRRVANVFSGSDVRLSMSIINPATFVGSLLDKGRAAGQANWFTKHVPAHEVSWLPCIDRIQEALPDVPITLWTEEDAPLVWVRILRHLGDLGDDVTMRSPLSAVRSMLSHEGSERLYAYAQKFPPTTTEAFERIALAFLDKYEQVDIVGPAEGIPGWDEDDLEEITAGYDEDIAALSKRDGITVIQPQQVAEDLGLNQ